MKCFAQNSKIDQKTNKGTVFHRAPSDVAKRQEQEGKALVLLDRLPCCPLVFGVPLAERGLRFAASPIRIPPGCCSA